LSIDYDQAAARAEQALGLMQQAFPGRSDGQYIGEDHDFSGGRRQAGWVRLKQMGVVVGAPTATRTLEHGGGAVEAKQMALGRQALTQSWQIESCAAADLNHQGFRNPARGKVVGDGAT